MSSCSCVASGHRDRVLVVIAHATFRIGPRWGLLARSSEEPRGKGRTVVGALFCSWLLCRLSVRPLPCSSQRVTMAEVFSDLLQATLRNRDPNANPWSLLRDALTARVRRVAPYHIVAQLYALSAIIAV